MSATKLTALATLVDSGDRFVTIDAGYAGHFDLHFNERIPVEIAALNGQRNAVRVTVEPAAAPVSETLRPVEQVAADMFGESRHRQSRGWITPLFGFELQMAPATAECIRGSIATALLQARMDGAKAQLDWSNECDDEQPSSIDGRIRALIDLHVTRWLEASGDDATILSVVLDALKVAHATAVRGRTVLQDAGALRIMARGVNAEWNEIYSRAADELEAIVRECAPSEGT